MRFFPVSGWLRFARGAVIVAFVCLCAAAYYQAHANKALALPNGGLIIPSDKLDFGTTWETSEFIWRIPITNGGTELVEVVGIQTSCTCANVVPCAFRIEPGETVEVSLKLRLAAGTKAGSSDTQRQMSVVLIPLFKDANVKREPWRITGIVKTYLVLQKPVINVGETLVRGQPYPTVKLTAAANLPLQSLQVEGDLEHLAVSICNDASDAKLYNIEVTPRPTLIAGPFFITVPLSAVSADGYRLPPVKLLVRGNTVDDIHVTPSVISLGATTVGDTVRLTAVLESYTGARFIVESAKARSGAVKIRSPLEPGVSWTKSVAYEITVEVSGVGDKHEYIEFTVQTQDGATQLVALPIAYYGLLSTTATAPE